MRVLLGNIHKMCTQKKNPDHSVAMNMNIQLHTLDTCIYLKIYLFIVEAHACYWTIITLGNYVQCWKQTLLACVFVLAMQSN